MSFLAWAGIAVGVIVSLAFGYIEARARRQLIFDVRTTHRICKDLRDHYGINVLPEEVDLEDKTILKLIGAGDLSYRFSLIWIDEGWRLLVNTANPVKLLSPEELSKFIGELTEVLVRFQGNAKVAR